MPEYSGLTFIQLDEANRPSALGVMGDGDTFTSSVLDADTKETTRYTKETSAGIKGTSGTVFDNSASWGTGGTVSAQVSYQVLDTSTTVFDNSSAWGSGGTPSAGVVFSVLTTSSTVLANSGMWGAGLTDIVLDVTPQLGGTLDGQGNLITGVTNLNWDSGYGNLGGTSATVFGSSGTWGGNSTPSAGVSYSVLDTSTTVFDNSAAWGVNNVVSAGVVYSVLDTSTTVFDNSGAWGSGGTPSAGVVYSVSTLSGVVFDNSTTWADNSVPSAGVSYSVLDTSTTVFDNSASWGAGGTVSAGVVYSVSTLSGVVADTSTTWGDNSVPSAGVSYSVLDTSTTVFDNSGAWGAGGTPSAGVVYSVSTLSGVVSDTSTAWGTTDIVLDVTPVLGGHLDADMKQIINVRKVLGASAGAGQDFDISANVTTIKGQGLAQLSSTGAVRLSTNTDTGFQLVNSTSNWTGDMVSSLHAVDQVTDTVTDNSGAWGSGGTVSAGVVYSVSTLSGVVSDTSTTWGANSTPSAQISYQVLETSTTVFDNSAAWGTNNVVSAGVAYSVFDTSTTVLDNSATWGANSTPSAGVSYSVLDTSTTVFDNSAAWNTNNVVSAGVVYSVLDTSTTVFDNSAAWGATGEVSSGVSYSVLDTSTTVFDNSASWGAGLTDIVQDITPTLGGHLDADGKQIINVRKVLGVSSGVGADFELSASFVSIKGQGNTHVSGVAAVRLACDTETGFQLLHPTDNWTGDMVSSMHAVDRVTDTVTDNSGAWATGEVSSGVSYSVLDTSTTVFDNSSTWGANSTPSAQISYQVLETSTTVFDNSAAWGTNNVVSAGVVYSVLDTSTTVFDNSTAWGGGITALVEDESPQVYGSIVGGNFDINSQQLMNVSSVIGRETQTLQVSGQNVEIKSDATLKVWANGNTGGQLALAAAHSNAAVRYALSSPDTIWLGDLGTSATQWNAKEVETTVNENTLWDPAAQTVLDNSSSWTNSSGTASAIAWTSNVPVMIVSGYGPGDSQYKPVHGSVFTFDQRAQSLSWVKPQLLGANLGSPSAVASLASGVNVFSAGPETIAIFDNKVYCNSGLDVSGGLDVTGTTNLDDTDLVGSFNVTGTTTLRATIISGDLDVTGTIDSTDDMTCVQTLQGRNCIATHSLTTNSVATFDGVTSATAGINVAGQAYYDNSTIIVNKGKIGINSEMPIPAPFSMGIMGGAGTAVSTVATFGNQTTGDPTKVENDAVALNFDHDGTFQFNYAEGGFYKVEASLLITTNGVADVVVSVNQDASLVHSKTHQLHTAVDPLELTVLYVVEATGSGYVKIEIDSATSNVMNYEAGSTCMVTRIA